MGKQQNGGHFRPEFLTCFEAWGELAQQWSVCAIGNTS